MLVVNSGPTIKQPVPTIWLTEYVVVKKTFKSWQKKRKKHYSLPNMTKIIAKNLSFILEELPCEKISNWMLNSAKLLGGKSFIDNQDYSGSWGYQVVHWIKKLKECWGTEKSMIKFLALFIYSYYFSKSHKLQILFQNASTTSVTPFF